MLLKDSRGKSSWHFTLAIPAIILGTIWFLIGGIDITVGGLHVTTATKDGSDYLLYITPWLTALGHREWVEKTHNGHTSKDRTGLFANKVVPLTEDIGKALNQWLQGGAVESKKK